MVTQWFLDRGKGERGQVVVLAALAMVVLLGFVGLVTDVGRLYLVRQQMRNACDHGSMAGVQNLVVPPNPTQARLDALDYYCRTIGAPMPSGPFTELDGGYTIRATVNGPGFTDTVTITTPWPLDGNPESAKRLRVASRRTVQTSFLRLLWTPQANVGTEAVGAVKTRRSGIGATVSASNFSNGRTQGITPRHPRGPATRPDGQPWSIIVDMNNTQPGTLSTPQNAYVDTNPGNSQVRIYYSDTNYQNYLNPAPSNPPQPSDPIQEFAGPVSRPIFLDPEPYRQAAIAQGHYFTGSWTAPAQPNGIYFVDGDIYLPKDFTKDAHDPATATFVATGKIVTDSNAKIRLTTADPTNKLIFFSGARSDFYADPLAYFAPGNPNFSPGRYSITMAANNSEFNGTFYAPFDSVLITGNGATIRGALVGDTIGIGGGTGNGPVILWDENYAPPLYPCGALVE